MGARSLGCLMAPETACHARELVTGRLFELGDIPVALDTGEPVLQMLSMGEVQVWPRHLERCDVIAVARRVTEMAEGALAA
jgi:hypothetical protein